MANSSDSRAPLVEDQPVMNRGGGFCLPPPKAGATIKSKAAQLEETREMLSQPPIVKASTSKQIAFDLGLVPSKEGADYSDFKIVSKFVARTLADISEGGGTQIKESVQLTGGVRSAEVSFYMHYLHETFEWKCFTARHSSHLAFSFHTLDSQDEGAKMFQDLADGPPAASGKKTVEQVKEEDEIAARAVERRHGRILDIDTRCVALSTGGQQVRPEMLSQLKRLLLMQPCAAATAAAACFMCASLKIDFSRTDPWDWWKRGVLLEGEAEVFAMRLTGAVGMPSTDQVSEIYGKGCLMLTKTPMAPPTEVRGYHMHAQSKGPV
jgi:hypothetical protein